MGVFSTHFMPLISTLVSKIIPLRRLKVAILKFSLMYLINNVHAAASRIQLPLPLKPAASSKTCRFL
jgi:hypothetical protein